jgi:hypothetical protein
MPRQHRRATAAATVLLTLASTPLAAEAPVTRSETRGTWAHEAIACGDPRSDGRIAIREKEIAFFASSCKIMHVHLQSKSAWVGDFRCEESGEFQDARIELWTPGVDPDPNRLNLRVDRGAWRALVRCPRDVPVR